MPVAPAVVSSGEAVTGWAFPLRHIRDTKRLRGNARLADDAEGDPRRRARAVAADAARDAEAVAAARELASSDAPGEAESVGAGGIGVCETADGAPAGAAAVAAVRSGRLH